MKKTRMAVTAMTAQVPGASAVLNHKATPSQKDTHVDRFPVVWFLDEQLDGKARRCFLIYYCSA
jgi:hypothetical protein